jgi:hypothetical protein
MKKFFELIPVIFCVLLAGCSGMESHTREKPTAVVDGQVFHLDAKLLRQVHTTDQGFDLSGTIEVSSPGGGVSNQIHGFTLKPSWKGFPWYYDADFLRSGGVWERSMNYDVVDTNFFGSSRTTNGVLVIEFTWRNQGAWEDSKPEHFAAYDVGVWTVDAESKFRALKVRVPTP